MKKALLMLSLVVLLEGCATSNGVFPGSIFSMTTGPVAVTPYPITNTAKVGTGSCTNILGLFAFGDAGIHAAAASAGITKIQHVDYQSMNVLFGLVSTYKIIVYGE